MYQISQFTSVPPLDFYNSSLRPLTLQLAPLTKHRFITEKMLSPRTYINIIWSRRSVGVVTDLISIIRGKEA